MLVYGLNSGVSTPCGDVWIQGMAAFLLGWLELYMYGRVSDLAMAPYPPLVTLTQADSMAEKYFTKLLESANRLWHEFGGWMKTRPIGCLIVLFQTLNQHQRWLCLWPGTASGLWLGDRLGIVDCCCCCCC